MLNMWITIILKKFGSGEGGQVLGGSGGGGGIVVRGGDIPTKKIFKSWKIKNAQAQS